MSFSVSSASPVLCFRCSAISCSSPTLAKPVYSAASLRRPVRPPVAAILKWRYAITSLKSSSVSLSSFAAMIHSIVILSRKESAGNMKYPLCMS